MPADSTRQFGDSSAALQRFLSLFLRSEREVFRYVAALVPNVVDAEDIVQQTAVALWEKFDSYDPGQLGMSICPEQSAPADRKAATLADAAGSRSGRGAGATAPGVAA